MRLAARTICLFEADLGGARRLHDEVPFVELRHERAAGAGEQHAAADEPARARTPRGPGARDGAVEHDAVDALEDADRDGIPRGDVLGPQEERRRRGHVRQRQHERRHQREHDGDRHRAEQLAVGAAHAEHRHVDEEDDEHREEHGPRDGAR
jgi:hypothetical protein